MNSQETPVVGPIRCAIEAFLQSAMLSGPEYDMHPMLKNRILNLLDDDWEYDARPRLFEHEGVFTQRANTKRLLLKYMTNILPIVHAQIALKYPGQVSDFHLKSTVYMANGIPSASDRNLFAGVAVCTYDIYSFLRYDREYDENNVKVYNRRITENTGMFDAPMTKPDFMETYLSLTTGISVIDNDPDFVISPTWHQMHNITV